jgi:diguanylate cyclase (GGDEF)-like protein
LLLFDLDRFKAVNDRYGHAVGDDVLVAFCRVATASIRRSDLFARLGGEEFGCLLPGMPNTAALAIAEQIRAGFAAIEHASGETRFSATVSVGIAGTERRNVKLATLMVAADRALYRAKQDGRNRVAAAILAPPLKGGRRHGSLVADARDAASVGGRAPRGTKAGTVSR